MNMKIFNLICAEGITIEDDSSLIIRNPISRIELPTIPNNYSMNILFSVSEYDLDDGEKFQVKINFSEINIFDSGILDFVHPNDIPVEEVNIGNVSFDIKNLELVGTGVHEVIVTSNNAESIKTYFYVTTPNKE
ncbi:hypothetical protein [Carnobacterium maltaromaticum]|uniref:hypothetical protein n=1 Tax=Carnobacterium maltaromaticum TaxID=2751 RepID=UPI0011441900|nr:hypothetical protein [Carnobacterium maltaromaticum]